MSIKPVDLQVMVPKSNEISRIHNEQQQKNTAAQQQQASNVEHTADENLRQVHSQENAQQAKIKEKQGRNSGKDKSKKEKKKKKVSYSKDKKANDEIKTSTIDIRL
mgnify:CR=1 FL=1